MSDEAATADDRGSSPSDEADDFGAPDRVDPDRLPAEVREAVPDWDDPYLDRVSDRLMFHYDLERNRRVRGERWDLYGEMRVENQKQFVHPALNYANHAAEEYLLARRGGSVSVPELERLVDLGHDLADEYVVADEEHYGTDFTFVLVVDAIPEEVRAFVEGFRDRTLLKFGYYGHYDVNLLVVAPDERTFVASEAADVAQAFALWEDVDAPEEGLLSRIARKFWE